MSRFLIIVEGKMRKSNWLGAALSVLVVVIFLVWSIANAQKTPSRSAAQMQVMIGDVPPIPIHASIPIPLAEGLDASNTSAPATPTVRIRGTVKVNVVNSASNPVFVKEVACQHKVPIDLAIQGSLQDTVATTYNVPDGKVLVIEYVNAYLDFWGIPSDMNYDLRQVSAWSVMIENKDLPGDTGTYWFPYLLIDRPQGWGENVMSIRMYCSTPVSIRIAHKLHFSLSYPHSNYATYFNEGFQRMHVSGYLEDAQ
mgnify:CR=1 FL=1